MSYKPKIGGYTFPDNQTKEHWVLRSAIDTLEFVYETSSRCLNPSERFLMKNTIQQLKASEKRIKKQLIKNGTIKPKN